LASLDSGSRDFWRSWWWANCSGGSSTGLNGSAIGRIETNDT
jgi:hypothetical protein